MFVSVTLCCSCFYVFTAASFYCLYTFYCYFYMLCSCVIQSAEASCQLNAARQKSLQTTSHHMSLALSLSFSRFISLPLFSFPLSLSFLVLLAVLIYFCLFFTSWFLCFTPKCSKRRAQICPRALKPVRRHSDTECLLLTSTVCGSKPWCSFFLCATEMHCFQRNTSASCTAALGDTFLQRHQHTLCFI